MPEYNIQTAYSPDLGIRKSIISHVDPRVLATDSQDEYMSLGLIIFVSRTSYVTSCGMIGGRVIIGMMIRGE